MLNLKIFNFILFTLLILGCGGATEEKATTEAETQEEISATESPNTNSPDDPILKNAKQVGTKGLTGSIPDVPKGKTLWRVVNRSSSDMCYAVALDAKSGKELADTKEKPLRLAPNHYRDVILPNGEYVLGGFSCKREQSTFKTETLEGKAIEMVFYDPNKATNESPSKGFRRIEVGINERETKTLRFLNQTSYSICWIKIREANGSWNDGVGILPAGDAPLRPGKNFELEPPMGVYNFRITYCRGQHAVDIDEDVPLDGAVEIAMFDEGAPIKRKASQGFSRMSVNLPPPPKAMGRFDHYNASQLIAAASRMAGKIGASGTALSKFKKAMNSSDDGECDWIGMADNNAQGAKDLNYLCEGACGMIGNDDLKNFCKHECGFINDPELKRLCKQGK